MLAHTNAHTQREREREKKRERTGEGGRMSRHGECLCSRVFKSLPLLTRLGHVHVRHHVLRTGALEQEGGRRHCERRRGKNGREREREREKRAGRKEEQPW